MTGYQSKKAAASAKTIDEVNWADHEPDGKKAAAQDKLNKAIEPHTITFHNLNSDWVMRITADRRIEVNEDVEVTEAAQKVLDALQNLLKPAQPEQEPKHYLHIWGKDGERCVVCGDKDWMGTNCKKISAPQPEQEPVAWKNAATRLGEELASVGPEGYYDMTAEQWLDWAMAQEPRGKNKLAQPEQEPTLQEQLDKALHYSLDFYRRRIDALQKWQSKMRDPERTIVCDIIANGRTLEPAGDRYTTPPQRTWVDLPDDVMWSADYGGSKIINLIYAKAIQSKLKERNA